MKASSKAELEALEKEIVMLEDFKDNREVTEAFFEIRRENIQLEAQLSELQQSLSHLTGVKAKLDDLVRKETERIANEKKMRAEALMKALIEEIKKPKTQEALLKKALSDLSKVKLPSSFATQPRI